MLRIAEVYRTGAPADSEDAMDAVEAHRRQITERFYDCSHQTQVGLAEMYVQDPRFTPTYGSHRSGPDRVGTRRHRGERRTDHLLT